MPPYSKHMAWDCKSFMRWLKAADRGDWCVYHAGDLSTDRAKNDDLHQLADMVLFFTETNAIRITQRRQYLFMVDVWQYIATRTNTGFLPKSVIADKISVMEYRALKAIRDRDADISATRAVRDALSQMITSSDKAANDIIEGLKEKKLLQEAPVKGWELSQTGLRSMT